MNKGRGRLAQTGERPLSNPAIRGQIYVEEVFFRGEARSSIYHETSSILKCATLIFFENKSRGNIK